MYKLGVTGGIGSGKTTVSELLAKKGAFVFNADKESKKRLQNSISLQHKLINLFGNDVTEKGHLVLSKLAQVAFANKLNQDFRSSERKQVYLYHAVTSVYQNCISRY